MITVLRLGHRVRRDKRITTHCGLVARAFGADEILISGEKDESVLRSLKDVVSRWGGSFHVDYVKDWKMFLMDKRRKGSIIVHLTMYGVPFKEKLDELRNKDLVLIIGSEKVPPEVYELADMNLSVGNQPHSEVAALAIILYELNGLKESFRDWKIKVIPSERGKELIERGKHHPP